MVDRVLSFYRTAVRCGFCGRRNVGIAVEGPRLRAIKEFLGRIAYRQYDLDARFRFACADLRGVESYKLDRGNRIGMVIPATLNSFQGSLVSRCFGLLSVFRKPSTI